MPAAAGPPSFKYACAVQGVSNKLLEQQRAAMTHSLNPDGRGQQTDAALLAVDGATGKSDPIHSASGLIIEWAQAVWEEACEMDHFECNFEWAKLKLRCARGAVWSCMLRLEDWLASRLFSEIVRSRR